MDMRIVNDSKITVKDMYYGFVLKKQMFTLSYQVFTFVFLFSSILALTYSTSADKKLNLLLSLFFFFISISLGFLYPLYRALNWKNTLIKQSGKDTAYVQYMFCDKFLKATSSVKNYDFTLNYNEIVKVKETKKYLILILDENRFVLVLKNGFKSTKDFERVSTMLKKIF